VGSVASASEGRADPGETSAGDAHTHECACLDCGTALVGKHCHGCGQRAHVHRTLGAFFHDLLHGVLHFEGRTWRTLPMLTFRPGELTRRYIDGERTRFVSPLALFLFAVFLMFAVFSTLGGPPLGDAGAQVQTGMSESAKAIRAQVTELEARRAAAAAAGQRTQELDRELAARKDELSLMEQFDREGILAAIGHRVEDDLPRGFFRKAVEKFNKEPALTLYKLQANAYKFSWLLIPISVPLVWLLFLWRREHWQLYDHTVFVTYSLSFQSLSVILMILLSRAGFPSALLMTIFGIGMNVHIYRQFRGAYGLRRFSAIWRTVALTGIAGIAFTFFALALIAIGAAG
jgi:hypothetical protein